MKNSKIILARGIRLDKNYNNVLSYKETDLLNLLRQPEHKIYEASDYSFIDEFQNVINAEVPYGDCIDLNYMAFQNPRYNNKWFFCFIDKVEYNSEKSTVIPDSQLNTLHFSVNYESITCLLILYFGIDTSSFVTARFVPSSM